MLVIAVRLDINPDARSTFRKHILNSAANSLENEPGCVTYEASFADDGAACFVYEVYKDRSAFEAHLETDHFHEFARNTEGMIGDKRVEEYELAKTPA